MFNKIFNAENPCLMGISAKGGGHQRSSWSLNLDPSEWTTSLPSLRAASQCGSLTSTRAHGSSPSLRASEGCVAISFATGLLRWLRHCQKPFANLLIIDAAQPPRNDAGVQASFLNGLWAYGYKISARSAHNSLVTSCSLLVTKSAFTMAEILLSLTIIGVVAAITLPSLTGNINERTWNTQRKALYSRMSQAISLMPALNNFGTFRPASGTEGTASYDAGVDTAAETFVTNGLSKVLKINNICNYQHLNDCGINSTYTTLAGTKKSTPTNLQELNRMFTDVYGGIFQNPQSDIITKAVAFETANSESVLAFYNPRCVNFDASIINNATLGWSDTVERHYPTMNMCANFIFDLNGKKGPNTVGKDIGWISVLYPSDATVVMPVMTSHNSLSEPYLHEVATSECRKYDPETRLPNKEELMSMMYNKELIGNQSIETRHIWSSSTGKNSYYWGLNFSSTDLYLIPDREQYIYCVKR